MEKENKNIWLTYSEKEKEELHKICELYKSWLDRGKTERECGTGGRTGRKGGIS